MPAVVEAFETLGLGAGETVHDRRRDAAFVLAQDRDEIGVRIALVQKQRLAGVDRDVELALERPALRRARREIAEVVQPAFADRHHFRPHDQRAHLGIGLGGVFGRVVRMHAGGRVQHARVRAREFERLRRALAAGAGDDQLRDTGRACPREHRVAVVVEGFVGEVGADVDEVHGRADSG